MRQNTMHAACQMCLRIETCPFVPVYPVLRIVAEVVRVTGWKQLFTIAGRMVCSLGNATGMFVEIAAMRWIGNGYWQLAFSDWQENWVHNEWRLLRSDESGGGIGVPQWKTLGWCFALQWMRFEEAIAACFVFLTDNSNGGPQVAVRQYGPHWRKKPPGSVSSGLYIGLGASVKLIILFFVWSVDLGRTLNLVCWVVLLAVLQRRRQKKFADQRC